VAGEMSLARRAKEQFEIEPGLPVTVQLGDRSMATTAKPKRRYPAVFGVAGIFVLALIFAGVITAWFAPRSAAWLATVGFTGWAALAFAIRRYERTHEPG
jgi:hypothetical protein